jgi:hypothetical protein
MAVEPLINEWEGYNCYLPNYFQFIILLHAVRTRQQQCRNKTQEIVFLK